MNMPDIEQQKAMLKVRCEMEVFCPRCHRPLVPERSVLVQQFTQGLQVSSNICCEQCFDNNVLPILQDSGNICAGCLHFEGGVLVISDGRELHAPTPSRSSDGPPTADPSQAAQ